MKISIALLVTVFLFACKTNNDHPDVSDIPASVQLQRFDKSLAEGDTANMPGMMQGLDSSYPDFFRPFMANILGIPVGHPDAASALKAFQSSYKPVFTDADSIIGKAQFQLVEDIKLACQLAAYYCPNSKLPQPFVITSFVGPMDAYEPFAIGDYGDVSTNTGGGLALQFYLGRNADVYEAGLEAGVLYDYQVNQFIPEMMVVNTAKNIVLSLYPHQTAGEVLVNEMIEKGKRMYLLKMILPNTPDSLQMGYTAKQWEGCIANEGLIWNFFVKGDLLYSKEPSINQFYLKDGPATQELGAGAPGYIGLFLGRRIVEAYMEQNPSTTIDALLLITPAELLQQSKY